VGVKGVGVIFLGAEVTKADNVGVMVEGTEGGVETISFGFRGIWDWLPDHSSVPFISL